MNRFPFLFAILRILCLLFVWFMVLPSLPAFGQGLITVEVDPARLGVDTSREEADGLRYRYVRLDLSAIGSTVRLDLFADFVPTVVRTRTDRQLLVRTWAGTVSGAPSSQVTLAVHDSGDLFGKIEVGGRLFLIRPRGQGVHAVVELRPSEENEGNDAVPVEGASKRGGYDMELNPQTVCDAGDTCGTQTIDLLVVYTGAARTALGGTDAAAQAAIVAGVDELNQALSNTGLTHSFDLVYTSFIPYTESGDAVTDLEALQDPSDGVMDEVDLWRSQYAADLVSLITDTGGCGIGYIPINTFNPTQFLPAYGYNVVRDDCLTGNKTLAHEIGHNLALQHDWYVNSDTDPCAWHHGYVNQAAFGGSSSQRWRTIMAYNNQCVASGFNCTRLTYFSNPANTFIGDPMGVVRTDPTEPADAAYALDRSVCEVSVFRDAPGVCMDDTMLPSWDGAFNDLAPPVLGSKYVTIDVPAGASSVELVAPSGNIQITDVQDGAGTSLGWTSSGTNGDGFSILTDPNAPDGTPTQIRVVVSATTPNQTSQFFLKVADDCASPRALSFDPELRFQRSETPVAFALEQNYPNPFNPSTLIAYRLPEAAHVRLKVYTLTGREVATLADAYQDAGSYRVVLDGSELSAGVYLYVIQAGAYTQTRRMTLLK